MRLVDFKVIEQLERVLGEAFFVERKGVGRHLRGAVTARIGADYAVARDESRHHRAETPCTSHSRMQHKQRLGEFPWVGEVIDVIGDLDAVAGLEGLLFHPPPSVYAFVQARYQRTMPTPDSNR